MELNVIEAEKRTIKFDVEPMISFIVPVHAGHLDKAVLKRCLMSLDDQDYENREIVVVLNGGEDLGLENTAQFFVNKDGRFRLVKVEAGGACNARNVGFHNSRGNIVSFFNSDYKAKPGMARMWVDALLEHEDCGFVYGGYEYATAPAFAYPSRSFDPFLLDNFNYIDCGFPLWRKYVVEWDSEVKSLQDWDFWIRVIKEKNVKGHYLGRDYSFIAEPPRPGGLSVDSSNNWIERVKFVRRKNNIPISPLLVTSIGAETHGIEIAKLLKADFKDMSTIQKPNEYKAVYLIGFFMKPTDPANDHPRILASFAPEVKKIIHFVGSDIYWLRKFPYESMKLLAGVLKMGSDHILCENELSRQELKIYGIDAEVVPIPSYNDYELKPLPEVFKVALYLTNKSDYDKYLLKHTLSIVKAMPDIQFSGYADGGKDFSYPNFKHYGNMSQEKWKELVYDHSCVLRLVKHDTRPLATNDFMLAGRDAVTNVPGEGTYYIDTRGTDPLTEWDLFAPGFNDLRWPETKSQIVQKIRFAKRDKVDPAEREKRRQAILKKANKPDYLKSIYQKAGIQ